MRRFLFAMWAMSEGGWLHTGTLGAADFSTNCLNNPTSRLMHAIACIMFGDDALHRADLLDLGHNRGLGVVQLGLEVVERRVS